MVDQGKDLYVLCFMQPFFKYLFLTHAGSEERPQPPTERGSLSLRAAIPITFFRDTLPNWCHLMKSGSF